MREFPPGAGRLSGVAVSTAISLPAPTRALSRPSPESDLIAKARLGDPSAFEEIVRSYLPRVMAIAQNLVGRTGDAEDVAQEVFFKIHRIFFNFTENA